MKSILAILLTFSLVSFSSGPMFRAQNKMSILPSLVVSPTSHFFGSISGSVTVYVTCNTTWTVSDDQFFITCSPTSGTGNGQFILSVTSNPNYLRFGTVTVTAGTLNAYVDIEQEGDMLEFPQQ